MKRILAIAVLASAMTLAISPLSPASATSTPSYNLIGLSTSNRLVEFDSAFPVVGWRSVAVSGLASGEKLIGIDRRPKTGDVYGVGRLGTTGRLYIINTSTGAATFVATLVGAPTASAPRGPAIVLSGNEFGFDFNPAADALRIVSDSGQNLRAIPSNRTPASGPALLTGDTFTDLALNVGGPAVTGVAAAAYTNSQVNPTVPTSTVLFDIDTRRDLLVKQLPPNNGTLVTVGPLRFDAGVVAGFDIVGTGPSTESAFALLSFRHTPASFLAVIDLTTGQANVRSLAGLPFTFRGLTSGAPTVTCSAC